MSRLATLLVVAGVLIASACSSQAGNPAGMSTARPTITSPPSTVQNPSPGTSAANAETIDLRGADPCNPLADDALSLLGLSPASLGKSQLSATRFACTYRDIDGIYGIGLFYEVGSNYDVYLEPSPGVVVTSTEVSARRSAKVEDEQLGACTVAVDLGPTQSLIVNRTGPTREPVAPLCAKAVGFAAAAIDALTSK